MPAIPLSALIEELSGTGPRDGAFVRAFAAWLHERTPRLSLPSVERLGLTDVVLTFSMRRKVRLVISGYPPDGLPGEVTYAIDEADFPSVQVEVLETVRPGPYEICTLDYSVAGRSARVTAGPHSGRHGVVVVGATIGARQEYRIQFESAEIVTCGPEVLAFVD